MQFESARLTFRLLTEKDKPFYREIYTDQSLMRLVNIKGADTHWEHWFESTLNAIQQQPPTALVFVVELKNQPHTPIGFMGISHLNLEAAYGELGIIVGRRFHGKTFPMEMMKATIGFAFEELKLQKLFGSHHPKNLSARKLTERLGFSPESPESVPFQTESSTLCSITPNSLN